MKFFKTKPLPLLLITHSKLGALRWSPESTAWMGELNGLTYGIFYEDATTPSVELLEYAVSMLNPASRLRTALDMEKKRWTAKYIQSALEVGQLEFEEVTFYRSKGMNRTFGMLGPETDGKAWRIEFQEQECSGLGFDS